MKQELGFVSFMKDDPAIVSEQAIKRRVQLVEKVENILHMEIDDVVADDKVMYSALLKLRPVDSSHSSLQGVLRKYYTFINGKSFPRITVYEKQEGIKENKDKIQMGVPIPIAPMDGYEFNVIITKERNYQYDPKSLFLYTIWVISKDSKKASFAFETIDDSAPELTYDGIRMFDSVGGFDKTKKDLRYI